MASAPFFAIAPSRRRTAATGADAPSRAQLRPPKAIALTPTASWAKATVLARSIPPDPAAEASAQNTSRLAEATASRLKASGFSRIRVASYWSR
jgi:hypothetical protein